MNDVVVGLIECELLGVKYLLYFFLFIDIFGEVIILVMFCLGIDLELV